MPANAQGDATITITAQGDLDGLLGGTNEEMWTILGDDGSVLTTIGGTGDFNDQCNTVLTVTVTVPNATLAGWIADGTLNFTANDNASNILLQMGEDPTTVFTVGCPVVDSLSSSSLSYPDPDILNRYHPKIESDYMLCCIHPVTTNLTEGPKLTSLLLDYCSKVTTPTIWILPNNDPGSQDILRLLNSTKCDSISFVKNILPSNYFHLLKHASVAIGNSSSYIRDSSFTGTPVCNLGSRQNNRQHSDNVFTLPDPTPDLLFNTIHELMNGPSFKPTTLYGDGNASILIADHTLNFLGTRPSPQKSFYVQQ